MHTWSDSLDPISLYKAATEIYLERGQYTQSKQTPSAEELSKHSFVIKFLQPMSDHNCTLKPSEYLPD